MVLLPNNQDLTAGSGIINMPFLENIYHSVMDEALLDLGGDRGQVIFHLKPTREQDNVTQSQAAPQQYNPFFGRVPVPQTNTRNTGFKVGYRDVEYTAHIVIGPVSAGDDNKGIGDLKANQIRLTVVKEALGHVNDAISFTVDGRRYVVDETRIFGFSKPRYILVFGTEFNEQNVPDDDQSING